MKKYFKRTIIFISIILIFCVIIDFLQSYVLCLDDENAWRIRGFYLEETNTLDVVLVGASEISTGFSPGLAYENFGFTSYDYSTDAQSCEIWKSQLNEIRKTQKPKVIVIEVNGALYEENEKITDNASARRYLDAIPLSINKIETIHSIETTEDLLSYYFPIIKYHGEFSNSFHTLNESLYYRKQGFAKLRGFRIGSQVKPMDNKNVLDKTKTLPLNTIALENLRDLVSFLNKSDNSNVLFIRFPHRNTNKVNIDRLYRCNALEEYITENGFSFLNLEKEIEKIGLDFNRDFYDDDHLNCFGAEKLTAFLGRYLSDHYIHEVNVLSSNNRSEWDSTAKFTRKVIDKAKLEKNKENSGFIFESSGLQLD